MRERLWIAYDLAWTVVEVEDKAVDDQEGQASKKYQIVNPRLVGLLDNEPGADCDMTIKVYM